MNWDGLFESLANVFNSVDQPRGVNWRLLLVLGVGLAILVGAVAFHDVVMQGGDQWTTR